MGHLKVILASSTIAFLFLWSLDHEESNLPTYTECLNGKVYVVQGGFKETMTEDDEAVKCEENSYQP